MLLLTQFSVIIDCISLYIFDRINNSMRYGKHLRETKSKRLLFLLYIHIRTHEFVFLVYA